MNVDRDEIAIESRSQKDTQAPSAAVPVSEPKSKQKTPSLEDPYVHAPPKPDGDPWAILLKPEMEADKLRCDSWKEEVQTLLIFAGLFSAVVTAFLVESYKFLQPDPNDAIINLLTQIANGPNNNSLSPLAKTTTAAFTQTSSSVRINVSWFLSLIFSLTTVLIGTIALQWLREHQSYPGFSPKETLAILHMRSRALKAWHVPHIFAALPLLLQGALVLFLGGLIDFTVQLDAKLAIPVACVIGFIALFLAATTVLPAFQALFLLSGRVSRNTVPLPCAYKSPQSQIFRKLFRLFLHLFSFVWPKLYLREQRRWMHRDLNTLLPDNQRHLFPHIYTIWHQKSWSTFDFEWLSLRDAWHNGLVDKDGDLYNHREKESWQNVFPLSDITQCLINTISEPTSAKHTEDFLVAVYYCFQELSASIWNVDWPYDFRVDRRNYYFEKLLERTFGSVATFLIHGGKYEYKMFPDKRSNFQAHLYFRLHHVLFHLDQVCMFIDDLLISHPSAALERFQLEMKSRMIPYLLDKSNKILKPTTDIDNSYYLPLLYVPHYECESGFIDPFDSVNLLTALFERITTSNHLDDLPMNPLYTHSAVPMIMDIFAGGIIFYFRSMVNVSEQATNIQNVPEPELVKIGEQYGSMFSLVANYLTDEISSGSEISSLVFYHSAILMQCLMCRLEDCGTDVIIPRDHSFGEGLAKLVCALVTYKERMGDRRNESLEVLFKGTDFLQSRAPEKDEFKEMERFSDEWWIALFRGYESLGFYGPEAITSSTPLDIMLHSPGPASDPAPVPNIVVQPSSTSICLPSTENVTPDIVIPLSEAAITPNATSDALAAGKADEGPTGTGLDRPISSPSPQVMGFSARDDDHPHESTMKTPVDSVIDMRPSR